MLEAMTPEQRHAFTGRRKAEAIEESLDFAADLLQAESFGSEQSIPVSPREAQRKDAIPSQGKESDSELWFTFESAEDARVLYDFAVNDLGLVPGEVKLHESEHQHSVHFAPMVIVNKPEVIQGFLVAYEEFLEDDDETVEAFEAVATGVLYDDLLDEAAKGVSVSGAPNKQRKGNPYHGVDGKFTDRQTLAGSKKGSWSNSKARLKVGKVKKNKSGGTNVMFTATKLPCGRAARKAGKDIRCYDGKKGAAWVIGKVLGKKARGEAVEELDRVRLEAVAATMRGRVVSE